MKLGVYFTIIYSAVTAKKKKQSKPKNYYAPQKNGRALEINTWENYVSKQLNQKKIVQNNLRYNSKNLQVTF